MSGTVEYILRARDLLSGVLRNASTAANNLSRTTDTVGRSTERAMSVSRRAVEATKRSWDGYIEKVRNTNSETNNLVDGIKRVVGAMALLKGAKAIVKMGADLEASRLSFDVLLGNHEKALAMLKGINKFANETPYENQGLIDNAKMMLGFGTSAEKILPNLKMLGDIAMGNTDRMGSMTLAYSQMTAAGKLMGQDLLQMVNAGFNPLQVMAENMSKKTGKSIIESYKILRSEMEKGNISSKMVEDAFISATSKGGRFFEMTSRMALTSHGKFSTLVGSLKQAGAELGLKLLPYINSLLDTLMPLVGWIGQNSDMIIQLTTVILGAYGAFQLITWGVKMWTIAQAILNGTMMLNPIGLIITAIAVLIGLIVIAWNKFAWFRGSVIGVWESFKLFGKFLKDVIVGTVKGMIDMFVGLGEIISSIYNADWEGVKSGAKKAAIGWANSYGGGSMIKAGKEFGSNIGNTFSKGYQKGASSLAKKEEKPGVDANSLVGGNTNLKGGGGSNFDTKAGAAAVTGGGSKPTNITINLNKEMIGNVTIYPQTMTQGTGQIKDMLMEMLSQVLNSGNKLTVD